MVKIVDLDITGGIGCRESQCRQEPDINALLLYGLIFAGRLRGLRGHDKIWQYPQSKRVIGIR